nr:hypothetical protein [Synechococcus sp. ROS8604]
MSAERGDINQPLGLPVCLPCSGALPQPLHLPLGDHPQQPQLHPAADRGQVHRIIQQHQLGRTIGCEHIHQAAGL